MLKIIKEHHDELTLRIQDPGILEVCKLYSPQTPCHLVNETGNANLLGLNHYAQLGISGFTLSNELNHQTLQTITSKLENCDLQHFQDYRECWRLQFPIFPG